MVVRYICDHCGAKRTTSREMAKVIDCIECDGLAILEGSNAIVSNAPDTVKYRQMREDFDSEGNPYEE